MKQCNICKANCSPKGPLLTSNEPCQRYQCDSFRFRFPDCISRITINDTKRETVKWFVEWAKLEGRHV